MKKGVNYIGIAVAFMCHDGKGNYLFNKRSKSSRDEQETWGVGAGAIEFGETIEQALHREIKEEYNTVIIKKEFLGYRDVLREKDGVQTHWILIDFKVLINTSLAKNGEKNKFDTIEWFSLNKLPTPLHPQVPIMIERYCDRL